MAGLNLNEEDYGPSRSEPLPSAAPSAIRANGGDIDYFPLKDGHATPGAPPTSSLRDYDTDGLLHVASRTGDVEAIRNLVVELGEDLNARDPNRNGETPVWVASQKGHVEAVRLLCELGADPKRITLAGQSMGGRRRCLEHLD